jgi:hypothetical protein
VQKRSKGTVSVCGDWGGNCGRLTHHDSEAQAERRSKKATAVLYLEVSLAWYLAHQHVDAYDTGTKETGWGVVSTGTSLQLQVRMALKSLTDTAGHAHDPAASVVAHYGAHSERATVVASLVKRSSWSTSACLEGGSWVNPVLEL